MVILGMHGDIDNDIAQVDAFIRAHLMSKQGILKLAIQELLEAGGKRLRPTLVLLSGKFGRYEKEKLIPLAAAIEILHMATLVHDDIIDDSKMRRGMPTVQSRWGKDIAVFTGDFLFTKAFLVLTQNATFENMRKLSKVVKAICEGEIEQYQSRYNKDVTLLQYLKRIGRKTALLFALSCQVGAVESKCSPQITWHLRKFGFNFGMAFQITDDLLDFVGDPKKAGKPVGNDFIQGIYTLPLIYAINSSCYKHEIETIIDKENHEYEGINRIMELVSLSGGIDYSKALARRYLKRANTHIKALPSIPEKAAFNTLVDGLMEQNS
jgi:heptaprenyl diphosphate synthase